MQPLQLEPGRCVRPIERLLVERMREVDDPRGPQIERLCKGDPTQSQDHETGGNDHPKDGAKHADLLKMREP